MKMNKPLFHIVPKKGWMNDPNGLVKFRDEYHVFYQADPEHLINETIGWGHYKSKDLLHWEECPEAIFPDQIYDRDGCFTGSGMVKDDCLYILYTGHRNLENGYVETQNIAWSEDGIQFKKYEGNPVIDLPPVDTTHRFRDPKLWEKNGKYYAVIGGENKKSWGKVVYYSTEDLLHYTYCGVLAESDGQLGNMWECPNLTTIDGKDVLIISPKGLKKEFGFSDFYESGYLLGCMDYENGKFEHGSYRRLDAGFDFYAPQVMECEDRALLFAWFALPDSCGKELEDGWRHLLTLPRELSISDSGNLCMNPIQELEALRGNRLVEKEVDDSWTWEIDNRPMEVILEGDAQELTLTIADEAETFFECKYTKEGWSFRQKRNNEWKVSNVLLKERIRHQARLFLDYSTIEAFCEQGEVVFSSRIYPAGKLSFSIKESGKSKVKIYSLNM